MSSRAQRSEVEGSAGQPGRRPDSKTNILSITSWKSRAKRNNDLSQPSKNLLATGNSTAIMDAVVRYLCKYRSWKGDHRKPSVKIWMTRECQVAASQKTTTFSKTEAVLGPRSRNGSVGLVLFCLARSGASGSSLGLALLFFFGVIYGNRTHRT